MLMAAAASVLALAGGSNPMIAPLAQRYVGDKLLQAERLRTKALNLEREFVLAVATPSMLPVGASTSKTSRVSKQELGRNLNPGAQAPERRAVRASLRIAGGRVLGDIADVDTPTVDAYLPTAHYVGLDLIDLPPARSHLPLSGRSRSREPRACFTRGPRSLVSGLISTR